VDKKKVNIEQIKKERLFQVPEGYFEQLSGKIEARIALETANEEKPVFSTDALKAKDTFKVPANYFDTLQSKIEVKIANLESEEAVELNPTIFSRVLPFQAPEGYFKELPATVMDKVESKKSKWVFKLNWTQQTKWVLAPAMTVALVMGYFFFFNQKEMVNPDDLIAQVSTDDLIAYLEASDISTDEILDYIDIENISDELESDDIYQLDDMNLNDEELDELLDEFDFSMDV